MSAVLETDVLIVGSGPAGGSLGVFLSRYGIDHVIVSKYGWTANTPRAHITNQRTMEILRDAGLEGEIALKGDAAGTDGQHRLLHQPRRRGVRPPPHLGHPPDPPGRIHAGEPRRSSATCRRTCWSRSWSAPPPSAARDQLQHGVPRRWSRTTTASPPRYGTGCPARVRDPREIPDRRRRRPQPGRRRHRPADGGPDGPRRPHEHRLPGRPLPNTSRTARAFSTGCCSRARTIGGIGLGLVRMVRPWNEWLIVWGYDIDAGPPAADRGRGDADRPQPDRRRGRSRSDSLDLALDRQQDVCVALFGRAGFLHGRRRAPPSAVQRPRLQHLDPGRLQPRLEAGARRSQGKADPALLDSYNAERAPVGEADRHPGQQSRSASSARSSRPLGVLSDRRRGPSRSRPIWRRASGDPRGRRAAAQAV